MHEIAQQVGNCLTVGCSVHTLTEAKSREAEGADFVTYSPIFPTLSKPGYGPAVGLDHLRKASEAVNVPVFALGGVTPERVSGCISAGAYGVAVMSGLMSPQVGVCQAKAYLQALASDTTSRSTSG